MKKNTSNASIGNADESLIPIIVHRAHHQVRTIFLLEEAPGVEEDDIRPHPLIQVHHLGTLDEDRIMEEVEKVLTNYCINERNVIAWSYDIFSCNSFCSSLLGRIHPVHLSYFSWKSCSPCL